MSLKTCLRVGKTFLLQKINWNRRAARFTARQLTTWGRGRGMSTHSQGAEPIRLDQNNMGQFLDSYDNFLLDCDGVLWEVDHVTPLIGIGDAIARLRSLGKRLLFVTNNSMLSRRSFVKKFPDLAGFEAHTEDIFTVGYSSALYLKEIAQFSGKVYLVGGRGISEELDELGIEYIGLGSDTDPVSAQPDVLLKQILDPDVKAVIVAFDEYFSYNKLFKAVSYLSNPDCLFIVSSDKEMGVELAPGYRQPVTGPLVAAVIAGCNRQPVITGKPDPLLLKCILSQHPQLDISRTVMVGDSMKTDIPFATNCGLSSALVMTGATNVSSLEKAQKSLDSEILKGIPNFVIESLADFA